MAKQRYDEIDEAFHEIQGVSQMLCDKGEEDGKSRYMKIMAERLLFIEVHLSKLRFFSALGIGLFCGFLCFLFFKL